MGSSRSAGCCRSPRRPITSTRAARDPAMRRRGRRRDDGAAAGDRARLRRELPGLRRAQGLATVAAGGRGVARCTVARLMRTMGLQGVIRGKPRQDDDQRQGGALPAGSRQPAVQGTGAERALGLGLHLCRDLAGFVYVAFVIDAYARRIVGWRVSRTAHAGFVLDALEQALHDRRPAHRGGLVHHSDRGVQGGFKRSSQQEVC